MHAKVITMTVWTVMNSKGNTSGTRITSLEGKTKIQKDMMLSCCHFDQAT